MIQTLTRYLVPLFSSPFPNLRPTLILFIQSKSQGRGGSTFLLPRARSPLRKRRHDAVRADRMEEGDPRSEKAEKKSPGGKKTLQVVKCSFIRAAARECADFIG